MTKEEFCQEVASVEAYALAASNLLAALNTDHFSWSLEGAKKQYERSFPEDSGAQAEEWMHDHYDSISAAVRAVELLSEAAFNLVEPLWDEAEDLIPDGEDAGEKRNDG